MSNVIHVDFRPKQKPKRTLPAIDTYRLQQVLLGFIFTSIAIVSFAKIWIFG